jgi:hypothetical protein
MNKLKTNDTGGYPFVLEDIDFIQDALKESFRAPFDSLIDKSITADGFIIDRYNNVAQTISGGRKRKLPGRVRTATIKCSFDKDVCSWNGFPSLVSYFAAQCYLRLGLH